MGDLSVSGSGDSQEVNKKPKTDTSEPAVLDLKVLNTIFKAFSDKEIDACKQKTTASLNSLFAKDRKAKAESMQQKTAAMEESELNRLLKIAQEQKEKGLQAAKQFAQEQNQKMKNEAIDKLNKTLDFENAKGMVERNIFVNTSSRELDIAKDARDARVNDLTPEELAEASAKAKDIKYGQAAPLVLDNLAKYGKVREYKDGRKGISADEIAEFKRTDSENKAQKNKDDALAALGRGVSYDKDGTPQQLTADGIAKKKVEIEKTYQEELRQGKIDALAMKEAMQAISERGVTTEDAKTVKEEFVKVETNNSPNGKEYFESEEAKVRNFEKGMGESPLLMKIYKEDMPNFTSMVSPIRYNNDLNTNEGILKEYEENLTSKGLSKKEVKAKMKEASDAILNDDSKKDLVGKLKADRDVFDVAYGTPKNIDSNITKDNVTTAVDNLTNSGKDPNSFTNSGTELANINELLHRNEGNMDRLVSQVEADRQAQPLTPAAEQRIAQVENRIKEKLTQQLSGSEGFVSLTKEEDLAIVKDATAKAKAEAQKSTTAEYKNIYETNYQKNYKAGIEAMQKEKLGKSIEFKAKQSAQVLFNSGFVPVEANRQNAPIVDAIIEKESASLKDVLSGEIKKSKSSEQIGQDLQKLQTNLDGRKTGKLSDEEKSDIVNAFLKNDVSILSRYSDSTIKMLKGAFKIDN